MELLRSIQDRLKRIIVDQLCLDEQEVKLEASFKEDLGADSLDIAELMAALEEEFDIEIPDEKAEKISTVGEAADFILAHLHAQQP